MHLHVVHRHAGQVFDACLQVVGQAGAVGLALDGLKRYYFLPLGGIAEGGVQCGFCTPGVVVAGSHLLAGNPFPREIEIREALSGNICRCTGYGAILRAFEAVTKEDA